MRARLAVEDYVYVVQFPPERRGAILRGALVSVYRGEGCVGHLTVAALREIGVLNNELQ